MLAWFLGLVLSLVYLSGIHGMDVPAHATEHNTPDVVNENEQDEWEAYHADAYSEYVAKFDALFNRYQIKRAKNGRLMLRDGDSGPYKFVKRNV